MNLTNLSAKELRHAASLKEKIAVLQSQLEKYLGAAAASPAKGTRKATQMSAAGRARIIAAQKARWAKFHNKTKPVAKSGKRKMSAAGRAKIAAAARARWAKAKAAGKKAL